MSDVQPLPRIDPEIIESLQDTLVPTVETIMLRRESNERFYDLWREAGGCRYETQHSLGARLGDAALRVREDAVKVAIELAAVAAIRMAMGDQPEACRCSQNRPDADSADALTPKEPTS